MADLTRLIGARFADRLADHVDADGKLLRALAALAELPDRDVVLVDGGAAWVRALAAAGARVTVVAPGARARTLGATVEGSSGLLEPIRVVAGDARATTLPSCSADVIVAAFSAYRGVDPVELDEADRILRPGGRLLIVHDYGRDDISQLADPDAPEYRTWSRRDGPFLRSGFKIRVIHCWWTFPSAGDAAELLEEAFGPAGRTLVEGLTRPRLSYNVAVYHRSRSPV